MTRLGPLSDQLTMRDRSYPVLVGKVVVGVIIRNSGGRYVAWSQKARVGEFATALEAERAVHAERMAGKKKKLSAHPVQGRFRYVRTRNENGQKANRRGRDDRRGTGRIADYLKLPPSSGAEGLVTNPPYIRAREFLEKALAEVRYVALLVRTNFLFEESARTELLEERHPPTRIWMTDVRLPMMHRAGWSGKTTSSNTPYAWAVWDQRANAREFPRRFNWREICALPEWQGWLRDRGKADDRT